MRHARALLPYALASAAIVVAASVAMAAAMSVSAPAPRPASPASTGSAALLSDTRIAYWRGSRDRRWDLWVSELDGSRRWSVASERIGDITLTRWRPDGGAVSYVLGRRILVIAPLVGAATHVPLEPALVADSWAIVGYEWSRDGARLAVTLRPAGGASRESDVWALEVESGTWTRLTETGDSIAAPWVDEDEVLIESMSGFVGLVRLGSEVEVHPVTTMAAASPHIGDDGRLYLVGGSVNCGQATTGPGAVPSGCGGIWSMALDGSDLRREAGDEKSSFRLLGMWTDDRFVVDRAGGAEIVGEPGMILPWSAGLIRDVVPLTEREVVAVTQDRVLVLDPQVVRPTTGLDGRSAGLTVLLDRVYDPQVWRPPRWPTPLRSGTAPRDPTPRSAFVLGRRLWLVEGRDLPRAILTAKAGQWIGAPQWSPDGELLAVTLSRTEARTSALFVFDAIGQMELRLDGRGGRPRWSPDGGALAIDVWSGERRETSWIQTHRLDGSAAAERIHGSDAVWTERGLLVLSRPPPDAPGVLLQRIDLYAPDGTRRVLNVNELMQEPSLAKVGREDDPFTVHSLAAPPDGSYFSFTAYRCCGPRSEATVIVRTSDGAVMNAFPAEWRGGSGAHWAPSGDLIARVRYEEGRSSPASRTARVEVLDPLTGEVVASAAGGFGGWAADGRTWYVARPEGLFAHDLTGSDGVRVSPYGVPFSIAPR